jgi:hypothetical protein
MLSALSSLDSMTEIVDSRSALDFEIKTAEARIAL